MRFAKFSALMLACAAGALAFSPARAEPENDKGRESRFERICADQGKDDAKKAKFAEWQAKRADKIAERLKLTDAQKAAFKDLQDARMKQYADAKAAFCANKPDLSTFEKKIEFRESLLQRRLDALKAIAPKIIAFRNTLDDKQKEEFDHIAKHMLAGHEGHGGEGEHGGEHGGWRHHHDD